MRTMFSRHGNRRARVNEIWDRLGDPEVFIDPFMGTASVLFGRPNFDWVGRTEIINDADPYTVNFFRAMKFAPDKVAALYDLRTATQSYNLPEMKVLLKERYEILKASLCDPTYYSLSAASQWYFGQLNAPWQKFIVGNRIPQLHRRRIRHDPVILPYLNRRIVERRLRDVEIHCGDWTDVLHRVEGKKSAIFLDPPYDHVCHVDGDLYSEDLPPDLAQQTAIWAVANASPSLKIALCGFEGDYDLPPDWESIDGGANTGPRRKVDRIWFSP